jgi:hypothetical protein
MRNESMVTLSSYPWIRIAQNFKSWRCSCAVVTFRSFRCRLRCTEALAEEVLVNCYCLAEERYQRCLSSEGADRLVCQRCDWCASYASSNKIINILNA